MNFSNIQEVEDLIFNLKRINNLSSYQTIFPGGFDPIVISNFKIYIIADRYSLCYPKDNYSSLKEYEMVQIFIEEFLEKHNQETGIKPQVDERFAHFEWKKYFFYLDHISRSQPSYMGDNVPIKTVYQIIKDINKITKLRTFF